MVSRPESGARIPCSDVWPASTVSRAAHHIAPRGKQQLRGPDCGQSDQAECRIALIAAIRAERTTALSGRSASVAI